MRSLLISAVFVLTVSVAGAARAGDPSPECRDGAALCKDAFEKLEKCQRENADKADACDATRTEADAACKTDASACDRDGSRRPPRRKG